MGVLFSKLESFRHKPVLHNSYIMKPEFATETYAHKIWAASNVITIMSPTTNSIGEDKFSQKEKVFFKSVEYNKSNSFSRSPQYFEIGSKGQTSVITLTDFHKYFVSTPIIVNNKDFHATMSNLVLGKKYKKFFGLD